RRWLIAHDDAIVSAEQADAFAAACRLRAAGMPVAYVVGSAWFYGREFVVNENVLIPRPETEHLIDEALAYLRGRSSQRVLDVGVGSGAIACTIAAERARAIVDGVDISAAALEVARENARRLGVSDRCRFSASDLLTCIAQRYDVVTANLPYVPTADVPKVPHPVGFEPAIAVDGGRDGLTYYRGLLPGLAGVLLPGGLVLMEGAPPVIGGLRDLARAFFPDARVDVGIDYGGLQRYVAVQAPGG
ncbi:MAG TPA: peptide chain release factor N(5)-glutamine methyltransferase, partial [Candidatus Baltobacteraceae bacterium]